MHNFLVSPRGGVYPDEGKDPSALPQKLWVDPSGLSTYRGGYFSIPQKAG
ncbi:MAG: hypothetical protein AAB756_00970 [Patescibacteria group bacterium]